jgi:hypothetical protein
MQILHRAFLFGVSETLLYSGWILIEPKLEHFKTVVIIAPEIILKRRVEQRNTIQDTISIEVNKNVEQLFGHIVERLCPCVLTASTLSPEQNGLPPSTAQR